MEEVHALTPVILLFFVGIVAITLMRPLGLSPMVGYLASAGQRPARCNLAFCSSRAASSYSCSLRCRPYARHSAKRQSGWLSQASPRAWR